MKQQRLMFIYLNFLDICLTLIGLAFGLPEGNYLATVFNNIWLFFELKMIFVVLIVLLSKNIKILYWLNNLIVAICISNLVVDVISAIIWLN